MHLILAIALTFCPAHHHGHTHRHHHNRPATVLTHGPVIIQEPAPTAPAGVVRIGPVYTICAAPDGSTSETC